MFATAPTQTEWAKTHADLAALCGVSRRTITDYVLKDGFPPKTSKGWESSKVLEWCKANRRGPHNDRASTGSMAELKAEYLKEKTEREKIAKQRDLLKQAVETGELLKLEDVEAKDRRLSAAVTTGLSAARETRLRELPVECPTVEMWESLRERLARLDLELEDAILSSIRESIVDTDSEP